MKALVYYYYAYHEWLNVYAVSDSEEALVATYLTECRSDKVNIKPLIMSAEAQEIASGDEISHYRIEEIKSV